MHNKCARSFYTNMCWQNKKDDKNFIILILPSVGVKRTSALVMHTRFFVCVCMYLPLHADLPWHMCLILLHV